MNERAKSGIAALVLFVATVGAAVAGWLIYPVPTYPERARPVVVVVDSVQQVDLVQVAIGEIYGTDRWTVQVSVFSGSPPSDIAPVVYIALPETLALSVSCDPDVPCDGDNQFSTGPDWLRTRLQLEPPWEPSEELGPASSFASVEIEVSAAEPPSIKCTEYECRGSVPIVAVSDTTPHDPTAIANIAVHWLDAFDYRWDAPEIVRDRPATSLYFTADLIVDRSRGFYIASELDGVNEEVVEQAANRLFIAGAFVGLAGGALVGSAQEGLHWAAAGRRPRPAPDPLDKVAHPSNSARRRQRKELKRKRRR